MFLLGFRKKLTAVALCKSIESAIQWFQIHHSITFATIQYSAVYLSGARVSIFSTLVPRLNILNSNPCLCSSGRCCRGRGFESRWRRNVYSIFLSALLING